MNHSTTTTATPSRARRVGRAFGVAALTLGAVAGTATAASAQEVQKTVCRNDYSQANCFYITPAGNNDYDVHVGIDVYMSRAEAQGIIDAPGDPFSVTLMGDDYYDNALKNIPLTWVLAGDGSLSAEFDVRVDGAVLNEDDDFWDRTDELYARIRFFDPRSGTRTFYSGNLSGRY
jgi:hypothetical protein